MELIEAKILLRNLLKRIKSQEDGSHHLPGVLTDDEVAALQLAFRLLDYSNAQPSPVPAIEPVDMVGLVPPHTPPPAAVPDREDSQYAKDDCSEKPPTGIAKERIDLDLSTLSSPAPPKNVRLCLDFGTAMSKATLVEDDDDGESEEIHVLRLGVPGDQEEVSEVMLISSVYIDEAGKLWFGKAAVDRSMAKGGDESRQRLDNIKRRLSEEGWNEQVGARLNPTDLSITYGDMVLAYLMFMSWAVTTCLEQMDYPRNLPRRFAMPCLPGERGRESVRRLKQVIGEAQVLADTFYSSLNNGITLTDFLAAVAELRKEPRRSYPYVAEDITEPLGVAGSIMSWKAPVDMLILIVDVGAGTSDLSLYRIHYDPESGRNGSTEIENSSRGFTEAGNYLDRILIELIIKKSGITSADKMWVNVRSQLELSIRELKESLFNDERVIVELRNGPEVEIELSEFLQLDAVINFGKNLKKTMVKILESVDASWINWILADPRRKLVVALTGGGAELPMVRVLAEGEIQVNGQNVPVARALSFPPWLRELDENLEADYPRVAVSLGGARRRLIQRGGPSRITGGDGTPPPTLVRY